MIIEYQAVVLQQKGPAQPREKEVTESLLVYVHDAWQIIRPGFANYIRSAADLAGVFRFGARSPHRRPLRLVRRREQLRTTALTERFSTSCQTSVIVSQSFDWFSGTVVAQ
jgi:hypothetical protein